MSVRTRADPPFLAAAREANQRKPWLLFFLALLISILPPYVDLLPTNLTSPARAIALGLLGLLMLGLFNGSPESTKQNIRPGIYLIVFYLLLQVLLYIVDLVNNVSVQYGSTVYLATLRYESFTLLLASVGIALYTVMRVSTHEQRELVLAAIIGGLAFACIVGALQSFAEVDLRLLFKLPGFHEAAQLGRPSDATENSPTLSRFNAPRAFSTTGHPGEFSALAAVAVPLAIHFSRFAPTRWLRLLSLLTVAIALAGLLAANSRTGILVLVASMLVYIWTFQIRELAFTAIGGGVLAMIGFAAFPKSIDALTKAVTLGAAGEDASVQGRLDDYAAVSEAFSAHPFFGAGFWSAVPADSDGSLDNQWLTAIYQGGLIGVLAMLVLVVGALVAFVAALRRASTRASRDQVFAMGAVFAGLTTSTFTFDMFRHQQAVMMTFLFFGLLWCCISIPRDRPA